MKITIPHNIGDKIETTLYRRKKLMCPVCKNQHQVVIKGETFKCPSCNGWTPEQEIKEPIEVAISDMSIRVHYNCWGELVMETSYEIDKPFKDNREVQIGTIRDDYTYIDE